MYFSPKNNEKGLSLIAFSLIMGVASLAFYVYQNNVLNLQQKVALKQVSDVRIAIVEEKLTRISAFLVASNLVACKQGAWTGGSVKKSCQWNGTNYEGNANKQTPQEFALDNKGLDDKNKLTFDVKIKEMLSGDFAESIVTGENTWLKFSLVHKNDLNIDLGKTNSDPLNKDEFFVLVEGNIQFKDNGGKVKNEIFNSIIRRPVAVPQVKVLSSSCAQKCEVPLGEHPNGACRSDFYIDQDTMTKIDAVTSNLGPGLIYDLNYQRTTAYVSGASVKATDTAPKKVSVGLQDIMVPGANLVWADTVPCATLSETKTVAKVVDNARPDFVKDIYNLEWLRPFKPILIENAHAAWVSVLTGSSSATSLSQHSNPSGTVMYQITGDASGLSSIEPFRMAKAVNSGAESFSGLMNTTTVTNTYTMVWVSPPH